jgi:hypothetical protein
MVDLLRAMGGMIQLPMGGSFFDERWRGRSRRERGGLRDHTSSGTASTFAR